MPLDAARCLARAAPPPSPALTPLPSHGDGVHGRMWALGCRPQSAVSTPAGAQAPSQVVPSSRAGGKTHPGLLCSLLACDFHVGSGWCTGIYEEDTQERHGSRVNRAERDNCHKYPGA